MCTELATECPDCELGIEEPSGDLEKFLDLLEEHEASCAPAWLSVWADPGGLEPVTVTPSP